MLNNVSKCNIQLRADPAAKSKTASYFNVGFNGFVVPDSAFLTYACITYYDIFFAEFIGGGGRKTICLS